MTRYFDYLKFPFILYVNNDENINSNMITNRISFLTI